MSGANASPTGRSHKQMKGFTLVELIVSLTLMAIISAAVLSGLRTGLQFWERGTAHIEELRQSRLLSQVLRDSIGGAMPVMMTASENPPVRSLAFEGGPSRIRFVSRNSFKDGPNNMPRWIDIRWTRESDKELGELSVEERAILPPTNMPDQSAYWSGTVLQASSCGFDFLEGATGNKPPSWTREWRPASEHMPKAVRIRCIANSKEAVSMIPLDYEAAYAAGLRLN